MVNVKHGLLKSFNPAAFTAIVTLAGSGRTSLEGIAVARNIADSEMVAGRRVAVAFFDDHNTRDAVVIAVFS